MVLRGWNRWAPGQRGGWQALSCGGERDFAVSCGREAGSSRGAWTWLLFWIFFLGTLGWSGTLRAGDCRQWGLTRDPCNACLLARYYKMMESRPNDPFPMAKLRRCRSLTSLIRRYQSRVHARPRWYAGHVIVGHLYLAGGKLDEAIASYKKATALNPGRWAAHWSLGRAYQKSKKWGDAKRAYEKAFLLVKGKRLKKKVLRSIIGVSIAGRDMAGARNAFKRLVRLEPRNRSLRTEFARLLVEHGRYQEALSEYRVLIRQVHADSRRKAELLRDMGEVYERMGKDTDAVRTYRRAMRLTTRGHWLRTELTQKIIAIYRRNNDLPSLAAYYEKTWRSRGFFEWKVLAGVYDEMGRIDDAIGAYRRALRLRPSALDARDRLIALFMRAGRKEEALKALEKQARLAPGEPRYLIRLAKMYWRRRRPKRALVLLGRCGRLFASDPSVHSVLADLYSRWGRPNLAFKEYQRLVRIDPAEPSHLVDLGEQYWQRGQTGKARALWRRMLGPGLYRSKQEAYAALAQVLADHGLLPDAVRSFRKAIALAPKNPALYRALAPVLASMRKYDDALVAWSKVLSLAKGDSRKPWRREARRAIIHLWKRMGVLRKKMFFYARRFVKAKSLDDGFFLAGIYLEQKKTEPARKVIESLAAAHPENVEVRLMLADLYVKLRRPLDAVAQYLRLVRLLPAKAREFYTKIAELYLLAYRDDEALAYARKALDMSKGDAEGWARVASIHAKKGDALKAVEAYERALAIRPRFFSVAFTLAGMFVRIGKYRKAADLYHDIVARSPDEEMVARAGRQALDIDEYLGRFEDLERRLISLSFVYTHKNIYRKLLMDLYARWIPTLVRLKRFSPVPAERKRAKRRLSKIGMRALKPLLESLASKDQGRRDRALGLLGHLGNKEAALPLVRLALDPPEDVGQGKDRISFQVRALVAAGRLGDEKAVPLLGDVLKSRVTALREVAAWGLALAGGTKAYRFLLQALRDRKMGVEIAACLGLGRYGSKATAALAALVRDKDRRVEVRAACAWALGRTGSDQAVEVLLEQAFPGRSELATASIWALGMLARPRAVKPLASGVWTRRGRAFDAAVWALARSAAGRFESWKSPWGLDELDLDASGRLPLVDFVRNLRPPDARISLEGRKALVGRFRAALVAGLKRGLRSYSEVAGRLLAELDSRPGRFSLGRLDPDPNARRMPPGVAAVAAAIRPSLRIVAASVMPRLRKRAVSVLIKSLPSDVIDILATAVRGPDSPVRRGALQAAVALAGTGRSQRRRVVALLGRSYAGFDLQERCSCLRTVASLGAGQSMLLQAAASKDGFEASCALDAASMGSDRLLARVAAVAVRSDMPGLARAAIDAVSKHGICPSWLRSLGADPNPVLRAAAAKALHSCGAGKKGRSKRH